MVYHFNPVVAQKMKSSLHQTQLFVSLEIFIFTVILNQILMHAGFVRVLFDGMSLK